MADKPTEAKYLEARAIVNNTDIVSTIGSFHPFEEGQNVDSNPIMFHLAPRHTLPEKPGTHLTREDLQYLTTEALRLIRQRNPGDYVDDYEITIRIG